MGCLGWVVVPAVGAGPNPSSPAPWLRSWAPAPGRAAPRLHDRPSPAGTPGVDTSCWRVRPSPPNFLARARPKWPPCPAGRGERTRTLEADHPLFGAALAAIDDGDVDGLRRLLDAHPELVRARVTEAEGPLYGGYFHRATLLHHVAGNPIRNPLPDSVVDVARTLLLAGADPDAECGGGPLQPKTGGATTLGLVVTGAQAHRQGHTEGLLDVLLEFGATLDMDRGMFLTLYHTVEHRGQREVARMLHARGVAVDLPTAAGLGRLDLVASFFDGEGRPVADADRLWRHAPGDGTPLTADEVLSDALVAASANGWPEVVADLLDRGADVDAVRPWGPYRVSPLHAAAWAGWPEVVSLLLERGADTEARDPTHQGTPLDWARHTRRRDCVELLERYQDR